MNYIPPLIRAKIQEAKDKQLKSLDFTDITLPEEPDLSKNILLEIFELKQLESLSLNCCYLTVIPQEIIKLNNLKSLTLRNSRFTEIPEIICNLPKLSFFAFSWNPSKQIPKWICQIKTIGIDLRNNNLIALPEALSELSNLIQLNLNINQLTTLPDSLSKLTNLTHLDLRNNKLTSLPESLSKLTNLNILYLNNNKLKTIPESLSNLTNLTQLNLSINQLTNLPKSLGKLTKLTQLNLRNNRLTIMPECLSEFINLTQLDLSDNELTTLLEILGNLTNLTQLILWSNQLTKLPESLGKLINLNQLDLRFNQLKRLPESLGKLTSLTQLDLWSNQLTSLPESLSKLTNLTQLDLNSNQLTSLPESLSKLISLTRLNLNNNKLKNIPETLFDLTNLTRLDLSDNQLTTLSESLKKLTNLNRLDLNNNQITTLPESLSELTNLNRLDLWNNPLENPPLEIANQGIEAIKGYFRQIKEEGKDYLYEAKLLIVGEAGAGKTTLAKKINNPNYVLKDEISTQGIDVSQYNFIDTNEQIFRINIWDFGGQEIYHATHQFFLTKRSLYTLVIDNRKEDENLNYWLNIVDLLGEDSPVLIIKNEKQDRQRDINERALRSEFINLKATLATNFANNRDLPTVLKEIKHYITSLPHVGDALPKTWKKVREELEKHPDNYINVEKYFSICKNNGFKQRQDGLHLSNYLHDLGVCLHFQDDSLLRKTVILKPEWGTAAAYKVLDNPKIKSNWGRFTKDDLTDIWHEEQYIDMQDELLQLMNKFKLCYEIPGTPKQYIAPQLLSDNQPKYNWDEENNLILRYTYEFMPKGIISQFIVVMHNYIEKYDLVWKSGVILNNAKEQTLAEVIENYNKREIKIRVSGRQKKELMIIVTYEIDKIHGSYKHLKYKKLIPCNCQVCKNSQSPYFYEFNNLRERIGHGKETIECGRPPYYIVNVLSLIDDVMNKSSVSSDNKHLQRERNEEILTGDGKIALNDRVNVTVNVNTEAKAVTSGGNTYEQRGNFGIGHMSGGTIEGGAKVAGIINEAQQQNLAEAAAEIQQLLEQLDKSYSTNSTTGKMALATEAMKQIEANPTLKTRILSAIGAGSVSALEAFLNHPAASFVIGALQDWQETGNTQP